MGNPDASDEEVEAAAKAANCHDFIMQLEQGYDTMAGDAGARLSGGERQRITIARAMLKQASVIILDEATAYADPENEALIQQAISKLVVGKSLIVVAHRLNTIRNADQILVVANGDCGPGHPGGASAELPPLPKDVAGLHRLYGRRRRRCLK